MILFCIYLVRYEDATKRWFSNEVPLQHLWPSEQYTWMEDMSLSELQKLSSRISKKTYAKNVKSRHSARSNIKEGRLCRIADPMPSQGSGLFAREKKPVQCPIVHLRLGTYCHANWLMHSCFSGLLSFLYLLSLAVQPDMRYGCFFLTARLLMADQVSIMILLLPILAGQPYCHIYIHTPAHQASLNILECWLLQLHDPFLFYHSHSPTIKLTFWSSKL